MADKKKPKKKGSAAATRAITDRKRAEEEIEMLKHSLDVHYDGAYWIDSDNKFVYVNDAGCKALGYTREELIGKTIYEVNSKVNTDRMKEVWAGLRQGGSFSTESVHRRKDGSEFPVEVVNTYVRFGGREYVCGFARDITARKKMEGVLRDSEMRYRTLFEQSGDYILVMKIGKDGVPVIMDMNDKALRAHGYTREEMLGRSIAFLDPVTDLRDNDERMNALKKGELELFTTQHRRKDGSLFDVEVRAQLIRINGEQVIVSTERDITERKRIEAALKAREMQLAESQRIAHIGSWERNLTTGQMFWSDELFRIFGLDPKKDPVDFNMFFNIIHPDDRPALKKAIDEIVKTGKHYSIDYRLILRDGTTRIIHAQAEILPDESGKLVILRGTGQDITGRKTAEKALGESQKLLETIIDTAPT